MHDSLTSPPPPSFTLGYNCPVLPFRNTAVMRSLKYSCAIDMGALSIV